MSTRLAPYPAYKDSGAVTGQTPQGWRGLRLKHTSSVIANGATPPSNDPACWDGDIVWVTPQDISRSERLRTSRRRITAAGLASCATRLVPAGSLIVTCRAPVGSVARAETVLCTNQGCKALVPDERVIDSEFALKLLQVLSDEMQRVARGSTFTEMATSDLASILAPIPPLEEQRQIAAYLTYMDRRIGRLIAAKRRLIALLEEQKQAVIQRAVRRGLDPNVRLKPSGVPWLGDVPAGWKVKKLKFLVRSTGGMTPSKADDAFWRGEIPWVSPKDMKRATIVDTIDHISEDAVVATGIRVVQPPSVLIVVRGMILARAFPVAISAAPLTMNQDMKALTADARKLDPWFLRYLLIGIEKHVLTSLVEEAGHGTRCLRTDEWENLRVPLPPFDEQQDIKRHLDLALADTDASIDAARRQIDLLREYRTRLIADVVTGKLDVRGVALPAADGDADDAAGFGNELAAAEDADEGEDVEAAEDEGA